MGRNAAVSIVIPAYNAEETIGRAVRCSRAQRWEGEPPEVIVVDDGSTDRTAEEARCAGARLIGAANAGPAAARNVGWRESSGEFVFFTDSDCFPREGWVRRLMALLADEKAGAAGGSYAAANGERLLAACIQEEIALRHEKMGRRVRFLGSFNLAVKRDLLEKLDGFSTLYRRPSGEDNDFSYRARKAGYLLLFDKDALVDHVHPVSLGRYLREQARHGFWRMKLYRTHPERMGGDDYSSWADFIEPPAALLLLGATALSFVPLVSRLAYSLLFVLLASAAYPAVLIARRSGRITLLVFLPVRFLRSFARGIGMAAGIWRFWIFGGKGR